MQLFTINSHKEPQKLIPNCSQLLSFLIMHEKMLKEFNFTKKLSNYFHPRQVSAPLLATNKEEKKKWLKIKESFAFAFWFRENFQFQRVKRRKVSPQKLFS